MEEMKCPECGSDMKEFLTSFWCRGDKMACGYVYKKKFGIERHRTSKFAVQPKNCVCGIGQADKYCGACGGLLSDTKKNTKHSKQHWSGYLPD